MKIKERCHYDFFTTQDSHIHIFVIAQESDNRYRVRIIETSGAYARREEYEVNSIKSGWFIDDEALYYHEVNYIDMYEELFKALGVS